MLLRDPTWFGPPSASWARADCRRAYDAGWISEPTARWYGVLTRPQTEQPTSTGEADGSATSLVDPETISSYRGPMGLAPGWADLQDGDK